MYLDRLFRASRDKLFYWAQFDHLYPQIYAVELFFDSPVVSLDEVLCFGRGHFLYAGENGTWNENSAQQMTTLLWKNMSHYARGCNLSAVSFSNLPRSIFEITLRELMCSIKKCPGPWLTEEEKLKEIK